MADKPEKRAIGLYYSGNKGPANHDPSAAPTVIAKGFNELADEIIRLAKEHNVLVHEDPELANFLSRLDVGDEIPRELYVIIAELIAFATWLDLKA
ncbi:EscU/YscU/HrcU family type III secretion system export apparatus switch protein [Aliidiomarina soli]|uniref:Flagellar biosynthetic protein FlhB n=1 Tax=Aliidiomarina soli TaxID=1928574 RepID=A0A432WCY0_9GAMM|nr:EscU/YscU/HrcU family type III secretion system export apparatus switch protein [Aliidiomarina soli]RUO30260.1 flagellar biosynthesis protein FlhB [Aliidiomarina soli]